MSSPLKKVAESDVVTVVLQAMSNSHAGRTAQLKRVVSVDARFMCSKQMRIPRRPEAVYKG